MAKFDQDYIDQIESCLNTLAAAIIAFKVERHDVLATLTEDAFQKLADITEKYCVVEHL